MGHRRHRCCDAARSHCHSVRLYPVGQRIRLLPRRHRCAGRRDVEKAASEAADLFHGGVAPRVAVLLIRSSQIDQVSARVKSLRRRSGALQPAAESPRRREHRDHLRRWLEAGTEAEVRRFRSSDQQRINSFAGVNDKPSSADGSAVHGHIAVAVTTPDGGSRAAVFGLHPDLAGRAATGSASKLPNCRNSYSTSPVIRTARYCWFRHV